MTRWKGTTIGSKQEYTTYVSSGLLHMARVQEYCADDPSAPIPPKNKELDSLELAPELDPLLQVSGVRSTNSIGLRADKAFRPVVIVEEREGGPRRRGTDRN